MSTSDLIVIAAATVLGYAQIAITTLVVILG
jgi:hypothetical protein